MTNDLSVPAWQCARRSFHQVGELDLGRRSLIRHRRIASQVAVPPFQTCPHSGVLGLHADRPPSHGCDGRVEPRHERIAADEDVW